MKIEKQYRDFQIRSEDINTEKRTLELSFSSEEPVERYFGLEILDHTRTSVDMSRLNNGAPLLVGHDTKDQVGVVESAKVDTTEKKGRATVRFGNSVRANEIFQDVVDGIRKNVSVGYIIKKVKEYQEEGKDIVRAMRWQPMEISLVGVPADNTVGVGRSDEEVEVEIEKELKEPEDKPVYKTVNQKKLDLLIHGL